MSLQRNAVVGRCAAMLGMTIPNLVRRIVNEQHFSNQEEVIEANVDRFLGDEFLPDYIVNWCELKCDQLGSQLYVD